MLLWVVTLFNLFYKTYLFSPKPHQKMIVTDLEDTMNTLCPIQGFKCPDEIPCDCEQMCVNGHQFESFQVMSDDMVYVMNERVEPGTYCLPKGFEKCNEKTSIRMFSLTGWSCFHRNSTLFHSYRYEPCKSSQAKNNELNVLWDYALDKEVDLTLEKFYEKVGSDLRYRCKCDSKSLQGKRMLSILPFTCSEDYCLEFIRPEFILQDMGWNGSACQCGLYPHIDPNDKLSACMEEDSRFQRNTFIGKVAQMTEKSFLPQPFVRPSEDTDWMYLVDVRPGKDPLKYVESKIEDDKHQPDIY